MALSYDWEDENLHIGELTLRPIMPDFARLVIEEFGAQYMNRSPTEEEKVNLAKANGKRGFPGLLINK